MADLEAAMEDGRLIHAGFTPNAGEDPGKEVNRILAKLSEPPKGVPRPTAVLKQGEGQDAFVLAAWVLKEPTTVRRLQWLNYRLGALDSDREIDLAAEVVAFDPALAYEVGDFQLDQPVLLMANKFTGGLKTLDEQKEIKSFSPTPLEDVLRTQRKTDAHFSTYWPYDQDGPLLHCPRVNKACLPEIREKGYALMSWGAVFDLDLPDHEDWTEERLNQFETEELPKIVELVRPSFYYTTSHGARIGFVYTRPVDVEEHEQILRGISAQCAKAGIEVDASCRDWTRLFRAPRVVRDGKRSWDQWWFRAQEWPENRLDPSTAPRKATPKSASGTERVQLDLGNLPEVDLDGWFPGSDADPDAPPLRDHHRELIVRGCELTVVQNLLSRFPEEASEEERVRWEGWESRNEPQMAATCAMVHAGMTDEQIGAVLLSDALGISRAIKQVEGGKRRPKLEAYVERQIGRARGQVGEESRVAQTLAKLRAANDQVDISPGMLDSALDEVQEALIANEVPLFQRGGKLMMPIRLDKDEGDAKKGIRRKKGSLVLHQPPGSGLLSIFVKHCGFYKMGQKGAPIPADPEIKLANVFAAGRERWLLRPLSGVTGVPVFRPDGTIFQTPGYDPETGLWYDPGIWTFPVVPENPTREDALKALEALRQPFSEYSIPKPECWSALFATLLSTVIAPTVDAVPMLGVSSPDFGYGKTKIAESIAIMATGGEGASMTQGPSEEEDGKRIDAALIAGDVLLLIDNCERPVGGPVIASVVTNGSQKPRRLGKSDVAEVPSRVQMIFNGKNLCFQEDAVRRALLVEIEDPDLKGKPWEREFTFDPVELIREIRGEVIAAALTILRAWHLAGKPKPEDYKPLGSFDGWEPVRLALLWLGQEDPQKTQALIEEDDPQREEDRSLLDALWQAFGTKSFKAKDLVSDDKDAPLARLLMDERGYPLSPRGIGRRLNRLRGSWVDGVRLVRTDDPGHRGMTYQIERDDGARLPF